MTEANSKVLRRSAHQTQWAAQFAVASELCKKGYQVALTLGNHPTVDLMVQSPSGQQFKVDVKGLYKPNFWAVRAKPLSDWLYYVFAYVPENAPNQFFVAEQRTVNELISSDINRLRENRIQKGRSIEKVESFPGIPWKDLQPFRDKWEEVLPR